MRRSIAGSFRAYLYVRVSTRDQAEYGTSLDGQRDCGSKFCSGEGYPAPEVRIEVESAGEEKQERRLEMNRLLKELRAGDVLVCKDLSRWSRDQVRAVSSVRELRARGVKVRFYDQPFLDPQPGSPVDLLGIIAWAAETERKTTLHRSIGNRKLARQRGAFVEGRPPLGYSVRDRKLVIVAEHAVIVRRIFTDSLNGLSVREISDALRAEYPSVVVGRDKKHVMLWTANSILKILRNRLYTGWMETTGKGRKHADTGSGQWLQTHEPIIDVATFERVSQGLTLRKRSGRTVEQSLTADFLLKRTAVCSVCGYTVRTMMDRRVQSGESAYYLCAKRCDPAKYKDHKPCPNKRLVRRHGADATAESLILERLDSLAAELAVSPPRTREESPPDWKRLAAELAEARANVVRLVAKCIITEQDAARQLTEFKRDEEALEARRAEWERRETNDTEETRRAAFAKLSEVRTVWKRLSIGDRRELISELAERVMITPAGNVEVEWRPVTQVAAEMGAEAAQTPRVAAA